MQVFSVCSSDRVSWESSVLAQTLTAIFSVTSGNISILLLMICTQTLVSLDPLSAVWKREIQTVCFEYASALVWSILLFGSMWNECWRIWAQICGAADCCVPIGCEGNVVERKRVLNNSCPKQTSESESLGLLGFCVNNVKSWLKWWRQDRQRRTIMWFIWFIIWFLLFCVNLWSREEKSSWTPAMRCSSHTQMLVMFSVITL